MMIEFESKERKGERPARLFQQGYTRKNKDVNVIPPLGSSTPLNDTTMLSDDSSETNPKVHVLSPLTSETIALNPQVDDQGSNSRKIKKLQSYLDKEFEIKDLGALKYFLSIEVS
ncbi:hypothetical protein CK203_105383 [Vitis vinifera]|uniref:Reverse transcriptase Ty1/copia-type domain-containing protein n=1 Tax=Vitis vinifera TaxID=29760 RepID=A0A438DDF0_VITVI|nr:hypothetical protein CK203_105383 [Vitis vinifera]